jgi:hypothetical protein
VAGVLWDPVFGFAGGAAVLIWFGFKAFEERQPLGGFQYRLVNSVRFFVLFPAVLLAFYVGVVTGYLRGAWEGLPAGVAVGLLVVLMGGLRIVTFDLSAAVTPHAILARDHLTVFVFGISSGLAAGTATAILAGLASHRIVLGLVAGIGVFVLITLMFIVIRGAWSSWELTRLWLATRGRLPWRLTSFLADAHRRGILRQSGSVYQFRHIELQHRLASRGRSSAPQ